MRQYSHDKIYKMLEPLMDMMKTEYPNNAVLIVQSDFAHISYMHKDMCFMRSFNSSEQTPNSHSIDELIHRVKSIVNNQEVTTHERTEQAAE